uniref:Ig-like domain-containing protein n=1 Tax=Ficedula albicollis TaxID=59894 RepID=A0A803V827_FICAL
AADFPLRADTNKSLRMLLLPLLALAAAWSRMFPLSSGGKHPVTSMDCMAEGIPDFQYAEIHWYRQVPTKAPERVLYIGVHGVSYDHHSYRTKYSSSKKGTNVCTLTINDINSNDEGTYYCAYWHFHRTSTTWIKYFGTGTKLIVSSKIIQLENQTTYVCLIEKFYPEVIRVTWTDDEKEVTDNVVKGDAWQSAKGDDDYSIASWLTVPAENKDKKYYCKYEHEEQQASLSTQGMFHLLKMDFDLLL